MSGFVEMPAERAVRFGIEQQAAKPQTYDGMPVAPDEFMHSLAISLKRIADALESVVHSGRQGGYVLVDKVWGGD